VAPALREFEFTTFEPATVYVRRRPNGLVDTIWLNHGNLPATKIRVIRVGMGVSHAKYPALLPYGPGEAVPPVERVTIVDRVLNAEPHKAFFHFPEPQFDRPAVEALLDSLRGAAIPWIDGFSNLEALLAHGTSMHQPLGGLERARLLFLLGRHDDAMRMARDSEPECRRKGWPQHARLTIEAMQRQLPAGARATEPNPPTAGSAGGRPSGFEVGPTLDRLLAIDIARKELMQRGWPCLEPMSVVRGRRWGWWGAPVWLIETSCGQDGGHATLVVHRPDGRVLKAHWHLR
jgi:hypothetical protein